MADWDPITAGWGTSDGALSKATLFYTHPWNTPIDAISDSLRRVHIFIYDKRAQTLVHYGFYAHNKTTELLKFDTVPDRWGKKSNVGYLREMASDPCATARELNWFINASLFYNITKKQDLKKAMKPVACKKEQFSESFTTPTKALLHVMEFVRNASSASGTRSGGRAARDASSGSYYPMRMYTVG